MTLPKGRRPVGELHQHPGYAAVDHQLDPLMEVIRITAEPPFGDVEHALEAIAAVELAMKHARWQINNPDQW